VSTFVTRIRSVPTPCDRCRSTTTLVLLSQMLSIERVTLTCRRSTAILVHCFVVDQLCNSADAFARLFRSFGRSFSHAITKADENVRSKKTRPVVQRCHRFSSTLRDRTSMRPVRNGWTTSRLVLSGRLDTLYRIGLGETSRPIERERIGDVVERTVGNA
jgi:hypothetical protein